MSGMGYNINESIRGTVPDQGAWFDLPYSTMDLEGHTGLRLTLTTTPYRVLTSDKLSVKWDASSSVAAYLKVMLPQSLAARPSKTAATINIPFPRIRLILAAVSAGATDAPAFTITAKARAFGGAEKATFTAGFLASQPMPGGATSDATNTATNATNGKVLVFDFFEKSGTGPVYLAPGDDMDIKIVPGAHTTDALSIYGLRVQAALNANYTDLRSRV